MAAILEQIIASGMASGEFPLGDATLAARLVNTACLRFNHPRLTVEFEHDAEPTLDQIIGFCLTALNTQGGGVPITHLVSGSAITYNARRSPIEAGKNQTIQIAECQPLRRHLQRRLGDDGSRC